jgi:hypothetical protein
LRKLDDRLELQKHLQAIGTALSNLASAPAQPTHQNSLAQSLGAFESAVEQMKSEVSPSQMAAIRSMGGEEFFDPSIWEKVKDAVQKNAMTPAVARDFVQELASTRSNFLDTVREAAKGLKGLNVQESKLDEGSADLAFLIPRSIFSNRLGPFAKELNFINRLLEHFGEAITGQAEAPELDQLSSSIPTIVVTAAVPVIGVLGKVVKEFLDAWERIEKIRKLRADIVDMGLKGKAVEEFTEQITTTVDEVVETSTKLVLAHYPGDDGRRRELENAVRQDTRRLFGQIERGLTVEFRANPKEEGEGENQKTLQDIDQLGAAMKFPQVAREPMLLGNGEILEGELKTTTHTKRTTTEKKTSAAKKETSKVPKEPEVKA